MYLSEGESRKNYCVRLSAAEAAALDRVAVSRQSGRSSTLRQLVAEAAAALDQVNTNGENGGDNE